MGGMAAGMLTEIDEWLKENDDVVEKAFDEDDEAEDDEDELLGGASIVDWFSGD